MNQITFSALTRTVNLLGDRGPLGIEVMPYCSSLSGRMLGLHIKNIEDTSRTKIENIFQEDECIVQINGISLQDKPFADSQEVFRQALSSPSMQLEVVPVANKPRYEKGLIGHLFSGDSKDLKVKSPVVARDKIDLQPVAKQDPKPKESLRHQTTGAKTPEPTLLNPTATPVNPLSADSQYGNSQSEINSPTPQVPPKGSISPPKSRRQSPPASQSSGVPGPASLTNKKSGKRIKIDLTKGAEGLGFTVVTRDSTSSGPGPILVKNILQRGAAIKDGRLQPGDRILEVNGMDMTGRSQEELVAMLRSTKQGESVCVIVARQEDVFLPRELKGEDAGNLVLEDGREQLMYEVPLNETGSAGLGVSLKGNKSRETGEDLGIFIKSIIHGGAAYKDGRLRVNDQLIAVNGEALLGLSNHAAMETLRRSMSSEGNARGTIQLVVLRASRVEGQSNAMNAATNRATLHQSSDNQVQEASTSPPPHPQRSSSLLPTLWRRASEPLPQGHRQDCTQRPGEAHPSHVLSHRERRSCYTFGLAQANVEYREEASGYGPAHEFASHAFTPRSFPRTAEVMRNMEYSCTHGHTHMQTEIALDYTHGHSGPYCHTLAHPHGSSKRNAYTEDIRAMAGQMYGDPLPHSSKASTQRYRDTHLHYYAYNRALT